MALFFSNVPARVSALATIFILTALSAQAAPRAVPGRAQSSPAGPSVVTIVSGSANGAPLPAASDIAAVLDDVDRLRVLPVVGKGDTQNLFDLLKLGTIDLALVRADSLEAVKQSAQFAGAERDIGYVARLFDDVMHVVAKADISDLRQLAHRKVAVGAQGSAARFSAERIFARLGVDIEPVADVQAVALDKLRAGEIAAFVSFGAEPDARIAAIPNADRALRLVPAPWDRRLEDHYLPASVRGEAYPSFMAKDERIDSISIGEILVAPTLKADDPRAARLAIFIDAFFSKFADLQQQPRHPAWRDVNLAAKVGGWTRLKPAQDWLDGKRGDELRLAHAATNDAPQPAQAPSAPPQKSAGAAPDEFERFKRFVQKKRGKTGEKLLQDDTVLMFQQFQKWSGAQ